MPGNTEETKEKIFFFIRRNGPSLPVHISREAGYNILFTSAFLSEMLSEKKLKISSMRVGSSPLYFIEGQEPLLEKFSPFLKSKEREAFILLKEKKFLKDSEQEPAIRVALREIKDFSVPFRLGEDLYWRYLTVPESEFKPKEKIRKPEIEKKEAEIKEKPEEKIMQKRLDIFDRRKTEKPKKVQKKKTPPKQKANEKFLELVKDFLSKSGTEITGIEGIKKDELQLKIKADGEERLLIAFNRKKISEKEIVKAAKKASELGLRYSVLSLGELPKKVSELLDAVKTLEDIGKVE